MALNDPPDMRFEGIYTEKFRALSAPSGVPLEYARDVAALDLGIHLMCFGAYTQALCKSGLCCRPQHLEDIAFNFLTTTNTYYRYRDKVSYWGKKLWRKGQGPLFTLPPGGGPPIPLE